MKIELLDKETVKIVLSCSDMDNFSITYDEMDYNDPDTRRAILQLLQKIKQETMVDLTKGKLFIEAFPYEDGGCILYINTLHKELNQSISTEKDAFNTPVIYLFNDFDHVCRACMDFFQNYNHLIFKSSLFSFEKQYYIMVFSFFKLDRKISAIMSEYGTFFGKGKLTASRIREYGKCIIQDAAIEQIAEIC